MSQATATKPLRIFIICPVRDATDEERTIIADYITKLESEGHHVHYPPRDTNQNDPIGLRICTQNREAIRNAEEVHVYWNGKSTGSLFDLGMAFSMGKKVVSMNPSDVLQGITEGKKSFNNVLASISGIRRM
jgi:hypothetical protein